MMKLYELDARIRALESMENEDGDYVDPETGEVMTFEQALSTLHMEKSQMVEQYACWAKELVALAGDMGAEEKELAKRRRRIENKIEKIKGSILAACMGEDGNPVRFTAPRADVLFRLNPPSTVIDDETLLPERYVVKKISAAPDKASIKAAILAGEAVPGAHVERTRSVMIK